MIRRDWFKRHVEILAQALGAALVLKERGETQAAIASMEAAIKKAFGLGGKLALGLSLVEFLELACRGEKPSPQLLATMTNLFNEWAELLKADGRDADAESARVRAQEISRLGV